MDCAIFPTPKRTIWKGFRHVKMAKCKSFNNRWKWVPKIQINNFKKSFAKFERRRPEITASEQCKPKSLGSGWISEISFFQRKLTVFYQVFQSSGPNDATPMWLFVFSVKEHILICMHGGATPPLCSPQDAVGKWLESLPFFSLV